MRVALLFFDSVLPKKRINKIIHAVLVVIPSSLASLYV